MIEKRRPTGPAAAHGTPLAGGLHCMRRGGAGRRDVCRKRWERRGSGYLVMRLPCSKLAVGCTLVSQPRASTDSRHTPYAIGHPHPNHLSLPSRLGCILARPTRPSPLSGRLEVRRSVRARTVLAPAAAPVRPAAATVAPHGNVCSAGVPTCRRAAIARAACVTGACCASLVGRP
jgi:hypothetical protein